MTSGTRKPSAFDNVPNEVLNLIISSIPLVDDFSPISYETDGSTRRIHQILALMHVSRQFRFAILQHEVWLGLHFEFEVLAFATREDYYDQLFPAVYLEQAPKRTNLPTRITALLNVLFGDSYFKQCMERKTEWSFQSLEALFAVLAHLPTFTTSTRAVSLNLEGIDLAIARLRECRNLVRLDICANCESSLDLDSIGRFLPSLKRLSIKPPSHTAGSFKDLEGLEEFTAVFTMLDEPVLPISSAKTLTRMNLQHCNFLENASLEMFTSLKHLQTKGRMTNASLPRLLKTISADLCSLKGSVAIEYRRARSWWGLNASWILWDTLCLAHLEKICLGLYSDTGPDDGYDVPATKEYESFTADYIDSCMEVVARMGSKLELLEDVELWGGLDVEKVHVLGYLRNLKRLKWIISADRYVKGMGSQDLTSQVIERFRRMDKEVGSVTIKIVNYDILDGILNDPESDGDFEEGGP